MNLNDNILRYIKEESLQSLASDLLLRLDSSEHTLSSSDKFKETTDEVSSRRDYETNAVPTTTKKEPSVFRRLLSPIMRIKHSARPRNAEEVGDYSPNYLDYRSVSSQETYTDFNRTVNRSERLEISASESQSANRRNYNSGGDAQRTTSAEFRSYTQEPTLSGKQPLTELSEHLKRETRRVDAPLRMH